MEYETQWQRTEILAIFFRQANKPSDDKEINGKTNETNGMCSWIAFKKYNPFGFACTFYVLLSD